MGQHLGAVWEFLQVLQVFSGDLQCPEERRLISQQLFLREISLEEIAMEILQVTGIDVCYFFQSQLELLVL
jgi:hypothetical protein